MRTKPYLTSFCVILLLVASAVFTRAFVSSPSSHAAGVLTSGAGYGSAHNCPSKSGITHAPRPNVILTQQQAYTTINAQTGDIIEVQLTSGLLWGGPAISGGNLALQQPAGYAVNSAKVCVWRLLATGPGITSLDFSGTVPCKVGQRCPHLGIRISFTIAVQ
jgi:hypothetical protein